MVRRTSSGKKEAPIKTTRRVATDLTMGEHALAILEELEEMGEDLLKKIGELLKGLRTMPDSGAEAVKAPRRRKTATAAKTAAAKPAPKRKAGSASTSGPRARRGSASRS